MPKSTAVVVAEELEPTIVAPETSEAEVPASPEWGNWRYVGHANTTFTNVPLTAHPGDILSWCGSPGVGWEAADAAPTVRPDNWRPDPDEPGTDTVSPAGD